MDNGDRLVVRLVLLFGAWGGFRWLLGHWHTPTWLYVIAMVAAWFVLFRYRWIDDRERTKKAAIREMEQALIQEMKKDRRDEEEKP